MLGRKREKVAYLLVALFFALVEDVVQ